MMPGYLLHEGAMVICMHGGTAQPIVPNLRVQVSGQPITTQAYPYMIAGCGDPPPPTGSGPCAIGTWITGATRVTASGIPVLLQDSQAICFLPGTELEIVSTQMRVKGT